MSWMSPFPRPSHTFIHRHTLHHMSSFSHSITHSPSHSHTHRHTDTHTHTHSHPVQSLTLSVTHSVTHSCVYFYSCQEAQTHTYTQKQTICLVALIPPKRQAPPPMLSGHSFEPPQGLVPLIISTRLSSVVVDKTILHHVGRKF